MQYRRFEDLPVWKDSAELAVRVYKFTAAEQFRRHPGLRDQLERATLSISNNIAEGFERGTTNELLAFLYISRGSAGETRSKLIFMENRPRLADFKSEISNLKSLAESCSRQIRGWADSLQNSDIKGQRHLTDKSRGEDDKKKRVAAFDKELIRRLPTWHPKRKEAEEKGLI